MWICRLKLIIPLPFTLCFIAVLSVKEPNKLLILNLIFVPRTNWTIPKMIIIECNGQSTLCPSRHKVNSSVCLLLTTCIWWHVDNACLCATCESCVEAHSCAKCVIKHRNNVGNCSCYELWFRVWFWFWDRFGRSKKRSILESTLNIGAL